MKDNWRCSLKAQEKNFSVELSGRIWLLSVKSPNIKFILGKSPKIQIKKTQEILINLA